MVCLTICLGTACNSTTPSTITSSGNTDDDADDTPSCDDGYALNGSECADVDECATDNGGCDANATCTNIGGSRTCACDTGYSGDGVTCTDVDECATDNGGCDANATCTNIGGSRTCACDTGYSGDGVTCTDVDECATDNGGCDANATCTNIGGSRTCACDTGYSGDGATCTDVDECATDNGGCVQGITCVNVIGYARCECGAEGCIAVSKSGSPVDTASITLAVMAPGNLVSNHSCHIPSGGGGSVLPSPWISTEVTTSNTAWIRRDEIGLFKNVSCQNSYRWQTLTQTVTLDANALAQLQANADTPVYVRAWFLGVNNGSDNARDYFRLDATPLDANNATSGLPAAVSFGNTDQENGSQVTGTAEVGVANSTWQLASVSFSASSAQAAAAIAKVEIAIGGGDKGNWVGPYGSLANAISVVVGDYQMRVFVDGAAVSEDWEEFSSETSVPLTTVASHSIIVELRDPQGRVWSTPAITVVRSQ